MSNTSIEHVSTEMLYEVFSYLSIVDLVALSRVNKAFQNYVNNFKKWMTHENIKDLKQQLIAVNGQYTDLFLKTTPLTLNDKPVLWVYAEHNNVPFFVFFYDISIAYVNLSTNTIILKKFRSYETIPLVLLSINKNDDLANTEPTVIVVNKHPNTLKYEVNLVTFEENNLGISVSKIDHRLPPNFDSNTTFAKKKPLTCDRASSNRKGGLYSNEQWYLGQNLYSEFIHIQNEQNQSVILNPSQNVAQIKCLSYLPTLPGSKLELIFLMYPSRHSNANKSFFHFMLYNKSESYKINEEVSLRATNFTRQFDTLLTESSYCVVTPFLNDINLVTNNPILMYNLNFYCKKGKLLLTLPLSAIFEIAALEKYMAIRSLLDKKYPFFRVLKFLLIPPISISIALVLQFCVIVKSTTILPMILVPLTIVLKFCGIAILLTMLCEFLIYPLLYLKEKELAKPKTEITPVREISIFKSNHTENTETEQKNSIKTIEFT